MAEKRRVRIAEKRLKMTEKKLRMTSFSVTLRALARRVSYCRDSSLTLRMTERRVRMSLCVTLFFSCHPEA